MLRRIIEIDSKKCNGCGICADACHEGAITMVDGKARLIREDYCDGLGDCLPVCPTDAIRFVEKEAAPYDAAAAAQHQKKATSSQSPLSASCPGSQPQLLKRPQTAANPASAKLPSQLAQWPTQIKLMPIQAPYFDQADLLVAADCTAYAYGNFHEKFMKGRVTIIGCPKLDEEDYSKKLTEILKNNNIKSVTIVRMMVPCCGGIEHAVKKAVQASGKLLPQKVVTLHVNGEILHET